jgi:ABC-2 type transport system ATP-binding protein
MSKEDKKYVIEVEGIYKDFREHFWTPKKSVLKGVSFSVEEGAIYGFLGPNGAGKTTTIKILMGLAFPDSGSARILGEDVNSVPFKRHIGYLPESPYFYEYLNAFEFIEFYASLFGKSMKGIRKLSRKLLDDVGLSGSGEVQLRKFSKGMLQRIGLAQALVNDPRLLILDEPMTGLDPIGRKKIRDLILRCRDEGKTIFFSSHILSDVEAICDRVSIIVDGKIEASGFIKDLLNPRVLYYEVQIEKAEASSLPDSLKDDVEKTVERGNSLFIKAADEKDLKDLNALLIEKGIDIRSVIPVKETLDDIFVKKVNKSEEK